MQFYENCTNQKNWWRLAPKIRSLVPSRIELAPGGSCSAKNTKNSVFCESEHHTSLVWRLAANWVPPGGSCSSKNPKIPLAPTNLNHSPSLWFHSSYDSKGCTHMFRFMIHSSHLKVLHFTNNKRLTLCNFKHLQSSTLKFTFMQFLPNEYPITAQLQWLLILNNHYIYEFHFPSIKHVLEPQE